MPKTTVTIKIEPSLLAAFNEKCSLHQISAASAIRMMMIDAVTKFDNIPLPERDAAVRAKHSIPDFRKLAIRIDTGIHKRFREIVGARSFSSGSEKAESVSSVVRDWIRDMCPVNEEQI